MQMQPGTAIGSYPVVGPIGAGGIGEVYRARGTQGRITPDQSRSVERPAGTARNGVR
jgi:hypothetical protein